MDKTAVPDAVVQLVERFDRKDNGPAAGREIGERP